MNIHFYRWKILRSTNTETPKAQLFINICLSCPLIGSLSSPTINQRAAQNNYQALGFQDLYFLNFVTCIIRQAVWIRIFQIFYKNMRKYSLLKCKNNLVTLNLATTCVLATIFQRKFFNLLNKIIQFSDIMRFSDSFCGGQKSH